MFISSPVVKQDNEEILGSLPSPGKKLAQDEHANLVCLDVSGEEKVIQDCHLVVSAELILQLK